MSIEHSSRNRDATIAFARRHAQEQRTDRFAREGAHPVLALPDPVIERMQGGKQNFSRALHPTLVSTCSRSVPTFGASSRQRDSLRRKYEGVLRLETLEERITPAIFSLAATPNPVVSDADGTDVMFSFSGLSGLTAVDITATASGFDITWAEGSVLDHDNNGATAPVAHPGLSTGVDISAIAISADGDASYTINDIITSNNGTDTLGGLRVQRGDANTANFGGDFVGSAFASGGGESINVDDNITATIDITGVIGPMTSQFGDITGTLISQTSVSTITAVLGDVGATVKATPIGVVTAFGDIRGSYTEAGNIAGFHSLTGNINITATATVNIGGIVADTGAINSTVEAGVNIGAIVASDDISGAYTAQAGTIADVVSIAGDITADLTAGTNIDDIVAATGSITSAADVVAGGSISTIIASEDIAGRFTAESGDIGLNAYDAPSAPGITIPTLPAISGTGIISQAGDITGAFIAGDDIGNMDAIVGGINATVTADSDVGDIDASGDIDGTFTAENGDIGEITSDAGSIVGAFTAGTDIADNGITALVDVSGTFIAGDDIVVDGDIEAGGDISGSFTAGDYIAYYGMSAGIDMSGTFTAGGEIAYDGDIDSDGDISGTFTAGYGIADGNGIEACGEISGTFRATRSSSRPATSRAA